MSDLFLESEKVRLQSAGFTVADSGGAGVLWRCPDGVTTLTHEEALARLGAAQVQSNDREE